MVLSIASKLESVKYDKETLLELKRISKVLKNPESSMHLCKEALSRFSQLILDDGMTHYEVEKSDISKVYVYYQYSHKFAYFPDRSQSRTRSSRIVFMEKNAYLYR
jgi:hypothetical protein